MLQLKKLFCCQNKTKLHELEKGNFKKDNTFFLNNL